MHKMFQEKAGWRVFLAGYSWLDAYGQIPDNNKYQHVPDGPCGFLSSLQTIVVANPVFGFDRLSLT